MRPEINPNIYGQLIFDKWAKIIQQRIKCIIFSQNGAGTGLPNTKE